MKIINEELVYLLAESIIKIESMKELQKTRHLSLVKESKIISPN